MVDDLRRPETRARSPESRTWAASPEPALSEQIQNLRSLREWVLERLDSLETLARQRSASAPAGEDIAARERTIAQKLIDLEETECRRRAQTDRQEKEWSAALTQLEADRRLLTEAWERVERERIEYVSVSKLDPHAHAQARSPRRGTPAALPHVSPLVQAQSDAADSDLDGPASQAILRQFQTLCVDVRRSAESHRDSR
jgi:hypothetical protein